MIASIQGVLLEQGKESVVIEAQGVGFEILVSNRTLAKLPETGAKVRLLTHLVVREDSLTLFGFENAEEKAMFLKLIAVSGVGPKVAECALLYGFHKTECFPLDVWMKRAMATLLPGRRPEEFGENAGLAQQYLFHYSRLHPELFAEKAAHPPANRR